MSTLLRMLLIVGVVVLAYMVIMKPRQLRQIGGKARLVALVYVAAILISAGLRLAGWGT